jgi:ABC-2 type transport system ATP-binding protein
MHNGRLLAAGTPDEVKGIMHGRIVELRIADPRRAAALLRQSFPHDAVGIFGDRVHVRTDSPGAAVDGIRRILAGAALELTSIRETQASLEDVFVSVLAAEPPNAVAAEPGQ